jgi:hypothetical protein
MPRRDRRVLVVLTLLSLLALMAESVGVLTPALLLYAAPLLAVALPLLAGRYVGEERIARLAGALRRPRRRLPGRVAVPAGTRRALRAVPRGGRLIAHSLAVRPPPAALVLR